MSWMMMGGWRSWAGWNRTHSVVWLDQSPDRTGLLNCWFGEQKLPSLWHPFATKLSPNKKLWPNRYLGFFFGSTVPGEAL